MSINALQACIVSKKLDSDAMYLLILSNRLLMIEGELVTKLMLYMTIHLKVVNALF